MSQEFTFEGDFVWRPTPEHIEAARLTEFMRLHEIKDYQELMQRSIEDVAWFTETVINFLTIEFYEPYTQVVDFSEGIAWPKWCVGGKMNIVHNCLDKYIGTPEETRTAFVWEGEEGESRSITYKDLFLQVNKAANALRTLGLGKGDVIGLFMPMTLELVIAFLSIAKIGGVILPLFSGYGPSALVTRLMDTQAKALFTSDGFYRKGVPINMKQIADEAAEKLPLLDHIIVHERVGIDIHMEEGRDHWWHDLVTVQSEDAKTEFTDAEDPIMVIYTSGTTGRPKGAVHTHCGFPIKAAQDMAFGMDMHPNELIYWITDMGWMMGPWLVFGSMIIGSTGFIYDGAMDYPTPSRLWRLVEDHKINKLGLSPTLIRVLIPHGEEIVNARDLSSLRIIGSTGEPWNPAPWKWLFEKVGKSKIPIVNYSGGTEISGGNLMGNPILPLKPCSFSSPTPGMAVDVFDEQGNSIRNQVGELVLKVPWIGMTRGFWNDPDRYIQTYWSRWPDIWAHGDWAAVDNDGQWFLLGRSDDTIKVAGKRLGPAEIESILVDHSQVVEAAAIAVPHDIKGNEVVVFCVLTSQPDHGEELRKELTALVIGEMGKPMAPRKVLFVSDLPKTRNAKLMRRMVRSAYLGIDPGDTSSLLNPETLEEISNAR
jgi:acetyl-CoA synthetase